MSYRSKNDQPGPLPPPLDAGDPRFREADLLQEMLVEARIDRGQFVRRTLALGFSFSTIGTMLAACGGDDGAATDGIEFTADLAHERGDGSTVRLITYSAGILEDNQKKFEEETGYKLEVFSTTPNDNLVKMLTQSEQFDVTDLNGNGMPPLWDAGVLRPVPVAAIPEWEDAIDLFTDPNADGAIYGMPLATTYVDADQTQFKGVPHKMNFEALGVNKTVEPSLGGSYGDVFDRKYKGRTGIWTDPLATPTWVAHYLMSGDVKASGGGPLIEPKDPAKMTKEDIDKVAEFLTDHKKAGQFRTIWNDFGQIVNLMVSREILVSDCWNPVVVDARSQSKDNIVYSDPAEGNRPWYHFNGISKKAKNPKGALAYCSWWLRGTAAASAASIGYYVPTFKRSEANMPADLWEKTYGSKRDTGAFEDRIKKAGFWWAWPDEYDYLVNKWTTFLAS